MIAWLFDSPARLRNVLLGCAATLVAVMVVLLAAGGDGEGQTPSTTPLQNPSPSATSGGQEGTAGPLPAETPEATREYGSSGSVALEAVDAYLAGDRRRFAALASPDVVEAANEAPAPTGRISGDVTTLLGGPTQQQVQVPTTDGDLVLMMVIVDGAWQVDSMAYAK